MNEHPGFRCDCGAHFDDVSPLMRHQDSECTNPYSVLTIVSCWRGFNYMPVKMRQAIHRALSAQYAAAPANEVEEQGFGAPATKEHPSSHSLERVAVQRRLLERWRNVSVALARDGSVLFTDPSDVELLDSTIAALKAQSDAT